MSSRPLPKKLEEDLESVKYYKPSSGSEKTKSVSAVLDDSVERAMYDEILGPMMNRRPSIPSAKLDSAKQLASNPTVGSTDFTSSILTRLQTLEGENKTIRKQLTEQIMYNERLEKEVVDLKSLVNDPEELKEELQYFRNKNKILQDKLREMEQFLSDYGLVWVGNTNGATDTVTTGEASPADHVAFSDFMRGIKELNEVIHSEPAQVVTDGTSRKARLAQASELVENIKVVFYKNGLMIRRGPFRECGSEGYVSFMNDILDGYFPSEFKDQYPEGVTFDVTDRHTVDFIEGRTDEDSRLSAAQLLNRLPKTVIRNGEVVDVRAGVQAHLAGGGAGGGGGGVSKMVEDAKNPSTAAGAKVSSMVTIATPALVAGANTKGGVAGGGVVQIQVKWMDKGVSQTLLAHMWDSDSVEALRGEIVRHFTTTAAAAEGMRKSDSKLTVEEKAAEEAFGVELRSAYPPRVLMNDMSLAEAGLVPNGTVHARRLT